MLINYIAAAIATLMPVEVAGYVVAEGESMPGVSVRLTARGQKFETNTTSDGAFSFQHVPMGSATLSVELSGFGTATRDVCV